MEFRVNATSNCVVEFHKAPTIASSGTEMTCLQLNQGIVAVAAATFYSAGTMTSTLAPLASFFLPAGGGGVGKTASGAGSFNFGFEALLAATQYAIAVKAGTAGDFAVEFLSHK